MKKLFVASIMTGLLRLPSVVIILLLFSTEFNLSYGWTGDIVLDVPRDRSGPSLLLSPHVEDCHVYYYNRFPMTCGPNLAFNKATLRCDSLQNVAILDPECGEIFVLEGKLPFQNIFEDQDYIDQEDYFDQEEYFYQEEGGEINVESEFQDDTLTAIQNSGALPGIQNSGSLTGIQKSGSLAGIQKSGWHGKRLGLFAGKQNRDGKSVVKEGLDDVSLNELVGIQKDTGKFVRREADLGDKALENYKIKPHRKKRNEGQDPFIEQVGGFIGESENFGWHGKRIGFRAFQQIGFTDKDRDGVHNEIVKKSRDQENNLSGNPQINLHGKKVSLNRRILRPRQENKNIVNRGILGKVEDIDNNFIRNQKLKGHSKRTSYGVENYNKANPRRNEGKKEEKVETIGKLEDKSDNCKRNQKLKWNERDSDFHVIKHNKRVLTAEINEKQEDEKIVESQENQTNSLIKSHQISDDDKKINLGARNHSVKLSARQRNKKRRRGELPEKIQEEDDRFPEIKSFGWHGKRVSFGEINNRQGVPVRGHSKKIQSQPFQPHRNKVTYKNISLKHDKKELITSVSEENKSAEIKENANGNEIENHNPVTGNVQDDLEVSQTENRQKDTSHQNSDRKTIVEDPDIIEWNGVKIKHIRKLRLDQNKSQSGNHEEVVEEIPTGGWNLFHHLWKNNVYK